MDSILVKVTKGKDVVELNVSPETTFGELRNQTENKLGAVEGGLRLLHKGRSPDDKTTLADAKVTSGSKMLALATQKQKESDARVEKNAKASRDAAALNAMKERSVENAPASASNASVSHSTIRGDVEAAGQTSVLLKKGRETFRANIALTATVGQLKTHAADLQGINAEARDMKLLHKGKFLKDDTTLEDCRVRDSATMLLMFGARHHDKGDARIEMDQVEKQIGELEQKMKSVKAKARGRLLDSTDLALAKGEVQEMHARLKDNLISVRGEDDRKKDLAQRLQEIELGIGML